MRSNGITRRLFVVPLANNDHGKTSIIRAVVNQGERAAFTKPKRGVRTLHSPYGREIDALVIPRSFQETLRGEFGNVEAALDGLDDNWRGRDLVIFPSHLDPEDCEAMISLGQCAGYDVVAVPIILQEDNLPLYSDCLRLPWDERWTLRNTYTDSSAAQLAALGNDLWSWISSALARGHA